LPSTFNGVASLIARIVTRPAASRAMTSGATGAGGPSMAGDDCCSAIANAIETNEDRFGSFVSQPL